MEQATETVRSRKFKYIVNSTNNDKSHKNKFTNENKFKRFKRRNKDCISYELTGIKAGFPIKLSFFFTVCLKSIISKIFSNYGNKQFTNNAKLNHKVFTLLFISSFGNLL